MTLCSVSVHNNDIRGQNLYVMLPVNANYDVKG
jgi:hypothetical protein